MKIETVPVGELTTFPGNPRRGNLDLIRASLAKRQQYKPIIVSTDGVILAGNHTYLAAVDLGWPALDVVRLDLHSDSDEARQIVLVDNRSADIGGYSESDLADLLGRIEDLDLAAIGYNTADLDALIALGLPFDPGHGGGSDEDVLDETDRAGWPEVSFKLAPAYAQRWALLPGEDDAEHAIYLLDEVAL